MKTFLRENLLRLFLLAVPVLCLIVLWKINIYKIWYDNTPWRNLGAPPSSKVIQILDISFPNSPFSDSRTLLYVYTFDKKIYLLDGKSQWRLGHNMSFYANPDFNKKEKEEKLACAVKIKQEWGLEEKVFQSEESIVAQGVCSPDNSYQYAIYQITPDGSVWEKYVNGAMLDRFRESVSFWIKFATILYILVWTGVFKKDNPFKTRPDIDAN